jgi:hypothetical protein
VFRQAIQILKLKLKLQIADSVFVVADINHAWHVVWVRKFGDPVVIVIVELFGNAIQAVSPLMTGPGNAQQ